MSSLLNTPINYHLFGLFSFLIILIYLSCSNNSVTNQELNDSAWPKDTETEIVDVTNPATGKTWMDRNLGASRAATTSTDEEAYGDLYQWGRPSDGHQRRNSGNVTTRSNTDQPGHADFILAPNDPRDWRNPRNNNLWQGVNSVNNPCPDSYRLPTEDELSDERQSWNSDNATGAFASPLKWTLAGIRGGSKGRVFNTDLFGIYWSSTVSSTESISLGFGSGGVEMHTANRAFGRSVRCIKD